MPAGDTSLLVSYYKYDGIVLIYTVTLSAQATYFIPLSYQVLIRIAACVQERAWSLS